MDTELISLYMIASFCAGFIYVVALRGAVCPPSGVMRPLRWMGFFGIVGWIILTILIGMHYRGL